MKIRMADDPTTVNRCGGSCLICDSRVAAVTNLCGRSGAGKSHDVSPRKRPATEPRQCKRTWHDHSVNRGPEVDSSMRNLPMKEPDSISFAAVAQAPSGVKAEKPRRM